MTTQSPEARKVALRGIELMAQRADLAHAVTHAEGEEAKGRAIRAVKAWDDARTDADWEALRIGRFGAGKVGLKAFVEKYGDFMPIGQRK